MVVCVISEKVLVKGVRAASLPSQRWRMGS